MRINTRGVPGDGLSLAGPVDLERLAMDRVTNTAAVLEVRTEISVRPYVEGFRVKGKVEARVRTACNRCLDDFEHDVTGTFEMMYQKSAPESREEEHEIDRDDVGITYYEGNEIDLAPEIRQCVLLAIPMRAVCGKGCRGLCAGCGANLNKEACRCPSQPKPEEGTATLGDLRRKWGPR